VRLREFGRADGPVCPNARPVFVDSLTRETSNSL